MIRTGDKAVDFDLAAARTYFRARPLDLPLGRDPTLRTHKARAASAST